MSIVTTGQKAALSYRVTDPVNGTVLEEFPALSDGDLQTALSAATAAGPTWDAFTIEERAERLRAAAALLRERATGLATLIAREMGKSLAQGVAEVRFSADIFDYYAENGPRLLASEEIPTGSDATAIIERRPYGVLLGIMPWNYPYYQAARFVAPNLLAGNTVLLKPAESCPLSAQALQTLLADSGLPAGVYATVLADHRQIAQIIADARVRGVSLTGSERAGASVARIAGENLKKVVLELGGSDAHVVLDTADVAASAELAWEMRMENMGQACNSNKRIIVNAGVADRFIGELTARARRLVPGDPLTLQDGEYPPMSSRAAAQALLAQVEDAVAKGAVLHAGGFLPDRASAHFAPAVLTGVAPGMRAYDEELFGPVAVVYAARDDAEALRVANDTAFGLGAAVFSQDENKARQFAAKLETGMVSINAAAGEGPELPFGGVKRSGFGRELGPLGIEEFVNKRLVYIA